MSNTCSTHVEHVSIVYVLVAHTHAWRMSSTCTCLVVCLVYAARWGSSTCRTCSTGTFFYRYLTMAINNPGTFSMLLIIMTINSLWHVAMEASMACGAFYHCLTFRSCPPTSPHTSPHTCLYRCLCICLYICLFIWPYTCLCTCPYTCLCMRLCTYLYSHHSKCLRTMHTYISKGNCPQDAFQFRPDFSTWKT